MNRSVVSDNTNDLALYKADHTVWSTVTLTARGAVVYRDTGDPSTSEVLIYCDFGSDIGTDGGDYTLNWWYTQNIVFEIA